MTLLTQSLPSVMTLGSLFCSLLSGVYTIENNFVTAAWLIIAASLFDGLDGKVSRLFKTQSKFGVELDSIVDACSFGFAPALLAYQFIITEVSALQAVAFPVAFVFAACGVLRLARFNVQLTGFSKSVFRGVPIPVGAAVIASFIVFVGSDLVRAVISDIEWVVLPIAVLMSVLMVSTIKYDTFNGFVSGRSAHHTRLYVFLAWAIVAVFYPAEAFFPFGVLYISVGLSRAGASLVRSEEKVALDEATLEPTDGGKV